MWKVYVKALDSFFHYEDCPTSLDLARVLYKRLTSIHGAVQVEEKTETENVIYVLYFSGAEAIAIRRPNVKVVEEKVEVEEVVTSLSPVPA